MLFKLKENLPFCLRVSADIWNSPEKKRANESFLTTNCTFCCLLKERTFLHQQVCINCFKILGWEIWRNRRFPGVLCHLELHFLTIGGPHLTYNSCTLTLLIACIQFLPSVVVSSSPGCMWNLNIMDYLFEWLWSCEDAVMAGPEVSGAKLSRLTVVAPWIWNIFCSYHFFLVRTAPGHNWCAAVPSWSVCKFYDFCGYGGTSGSAVEVKRPAHTLVSSVVGMAGISGQILTHQSTTESRGCGFQRR